MTYVDVLWLPVFLAMALGSVQLSRYMFQHWYTPLSVFIGVNCASLFMYHLRLVYLSDVSLVTHLLALGGMAFFTLGVLAVSYHSRGMADPARPHPLETGRLRTFFVTTAILATMGWVLALGILGWQYGLGILFRNIWLLQLTFQMQFIGYLNLLGILVLPTFVLMRASGRIRWYDGLWLLSALFGLLLAGIKSYLIYSILAALTAWSTVLPGKFRVRYLASALLVMLVFFVVYTNLIDVFVAEDFGGVLSHPLLSIFMRPYVYLVGSWPALDNLIAGDVEPLGVWGAVTFEPLWKILGDGFGLVEPLDKDLPFTFIGSAPFNVYSFFGGVYFDWRWPGVMLYSFLLGIVSTKLYLRTRLCAFWGHHLVYSLFGYLVFLTFYAFFFFFKVYFMLLYIYLVGFIFLRNGVLVDRSRR